MGGSSKKPDWQPQQKTETASQVFLQKLSQSGADQATKTINATVDRAKQEAQQYTGQAQQYLQSNILAGINQNTFNTQFGAYAIDQNTQNAIGALGGSIGGAIDELRTNFNQAKQQFIPFQQSGLNALDEMTAMLGLPGAPGAEFKYQDAIQNRQEKLNEYQNVYSATKEARPTQPAGLKNGPPAPFIAPPQVQSLTAPTLGAPPSSIPIQPQYGQTPVYQSNVTYPMGKPGSFWQYMDVGNGQVKRVNLNVPQTTQTLIGYQPDFNNITNKADIDKATKEYEAQKQLYDTQVAEAQAIQQQIEQERLAYAQNINAQQTARQQEINQYNDLNSQYNIDLSNWEGRANASAQQDYNSALPALQQAASRPALTPDEIYAKLEATPGYQFQLDQGLKAIQNSAAKRGILYSGTTLQDLQRFGNNLAAQTYGQRLSSLADLVAQGYTASNEISQLMQNQGSNISQLLSTQGQKTADLYQTAGSNLGTLYGNLGQSNLSAFTNLGSGLSDLERKLGEDFGNAEISRGNSLSNIQTLANQELVPYNTKSTTTQYQYGYPQKQASVGDALKAGGQNALMGGAAFGLSLFSSKSLKDEITPDVSTNSSILDQLDELKIPMWTYFDVPDKVHIGPYAEDMAQIIPNGNGQTIDIIDMLGVILLAIKELRKEIKHAN